MDQPPEKAFSLFLQRLLLRSDLTDEEQRAILRLTGKSHRYRSHEDIVRLGEHVETACLVSSGLIARYDQQLDGRRQITSFYIPGDMCDLHSLVAPKASWSITAVSDATVIRVPHAQLGKLCVDYPALALAFWRDCTVDASIFTTWEGNLGRKSAKERLTHLFCEMGLRMERAGLGTRQAFELRATQEQLSEATGLTPVHVNRTLQEIRAKGLLKFDRGFVDIPDWNALTSTAEFDPGFLMFDGPPRRVASNGR